MSPRCDFDAHARAVECFAEMTDGLLIPEARAPQWRKWRAPSQDPNPLERLTLCVFEAHRYGMPEHVARLAPLMLTEAIDARYTTQHLALTTALALECIEAENAENIAEVQLFGEHRTQATLRTYARAKRREAMLDLAAADAADREATKLQWSAR